MSKPSSRKKVIILGIDAMDPGITEQLIKEGRLPNLSYLKAQGAYSRLKTTIPAESVVAWTSFITGLDPASHGIFDFVMRDPKTYHPYLSLNEVSSISGKVKIKLRRKGEAFWSILAKNKIPSFIYFCPNTFPPDAIKGKMLSGMGVPDITGTMGRFSFYTQKAISLGDKNSRGRIIQVEPKNNIIETIIYGPRVRVENFDTESSIPLKITINPQEKNIFLLLDGNKIILQEKSWSDWQKISFKVGLFKKVHGIVRFYLKSISPEFELYLTPVNFDPQKPIFPISYPHGYSKKIGFYYTQGMPHDTWALSENRYDEQVFLEQADEILKERKRILREELKGLKGGLFFFYFDTLDALQHMFWRYLDQRHPLYEKNSLYQDTIFKYYEKLDQVVGEVLKTIDRETTLVILSDHGFNSFRRSVHLNRWLLENGYLFLNPGIKESRGFFEGIDWSRTKAYALGFGGIYLNQVGRECYGIVAEPEARALKQEIMEKLKGFRDPADSEQVVENVYTREEVFKGPYMNEAPDLFIGFKAGYRASWQTALGGVPALLIEDNKKKWSGDHLIDPALAPGVIFINKKINLDNPAIIDIVPTLLTLFNINKPQGMPGKNLFKDADN